jgi:hypothetical protein
MVDSATIQGAAILIIIVGTILSLLLYTLPTVILYWILAKKAGKPGWSQLIPAYNYYVQGIIAKTPKLAIATAVLYGLFFLLSYSPLNNLDGIVAIAWLPVWIVQVVAMAKQYNASAGKWVLFILLPVVGVFFVKDVQFTGGAMAPVQPVVPPVTPVAATPTVPPTIPPVA